MFDSTAVMGPATKKRWRISTGWIVCLILSTIRAFATDYYVDNKNPQASDNNPGTISSPVRTIMRAINVLGRNDRVIIRAGEYRESLFFYRNGFSDAPVIVMAYPGDEGNVVIKGSEIFRNWSFEGGEQWSTSWTYHLNAGYPSDWPSGSEYNQAYIRRAELAFMDGQNLRQVTARSSMQRGTFYVDDYQQRLYI